MVAGDAVAVAAGMVGCVGIVIEAQPEQGRLPSVKVFNLAAAADQQGRYPAQLSLQGALVLCLIKEHYMVGFMSGDMHVVLADRGENLGVAGMLGTLLPSEVVASDAKQGANSSLEDVLPDCVAAAMAANRVATDDLEATSGDARAGSWADMYAGHTPAQSHTLALCCSQLARD